MAMRVELGYWMTYRVTDTREKRWVDVEVGETKGVKSSWWTRRYTTDVNAGWCQEPLHQYKARSRWYDDAEFEMRCSYVKLFRGRFGGCVNASGGGNCVWIRQADDSALMLMPMPVSADADRLTT